MTVMTADVLASIDGALAAYGTVGYGDAKDQMRWSPEPPALVICDRGAPLRPAMPGAPRPERGTWPVFVVAAHFRTAEGLDVCARATVCGEADRAEAEAACSALSERPGWRPRPASRCGNCNPRGNPEPLAVDGHEYARRRKGRQRRKRGH